MSRMESDETAKRSQATYFAYSSAILVFLRRGCLGGSAIGSGESTVNGVATVTNGALVPLTVTSNFAVVLKPLR